MSVLGLKSGYTVKLSLNPQDFPWAQGHILLYIPPLVLIRIQNNFAGSLFLMSTKILFRNGPYLNFDLAPIGTT